MALAAAQDRVLGAGAGVVSWLRGCGAAVGAVSWLRARRRCCQLAKRAGAGVSWLCALWRRRELAVRAGCVQSCSSQSHVNRSWDAA